MNIRLVEKHEDSYWQKLLTTTDNYVDFLDKFFEDNSSYFNDNIQLLRPYYSVIYDQLIEYGFNFNTNPWLIFLVNYYTLNRTFDFTKEQYLLLNNQLNEIIDEDELTGKSELGKNTIYYNPTLYKETSIQYTNYKLNIYNWFKNTYSVKSYCTNITLLASISNDVDLDIYNNYIKQLEFVKANDYVLSKVKWTDNFCYQLMSLCFTQDITKVTNSQYIRNKAQRDSHIIQVIEVKHISSKPLQRNSQLLGALEIEANINTLHTSLVSSTSVKTDSRQYNKSTSVNNILKSINKANYAPYDVIYVLTRLYGNKDSNNIVYNLVDFNNDKFKQSTSISDNTYYRIKNLFNAYNYTSESYMTLINELIKMDKN